MEFLKWLFGRGEKQSIAPTIHETGAPVPIICKDSAPQKEPDLRRLLMSLLTSYPCYGLVNSVVSANGSRIVTGHSGQRSADAGDTVGIVKIWDANSGTELLSLEAKTLGAQSVAISPDNRRIVAGYGGGIAIVWNAETGEELFKITNNNYHVNSVVFSPDSKRLVTGAQYSNMPSEVRVWDITSSREVLSIKPVDDVQCIAYSPNGSLIATVGVGEVKIWDAVN